jgi:hypothetical protein
MESFRTATWAPVTTEVYAVPAIVAHDDGSIYTRSVGDSTGAFLATGTDSRDFQPVTVGGASPSLIRWYSSMEARAYIAQVGNAGTAIGPQLPAAAIEIAGTLYFQHGDALVGWADGVVASKLTLPQIEPIATVPPGYKGMWFGRGPGAVSGIVPSVAGDIIAFSFTGAGANVSDVSAGTTASLAPYTSLGPAVRTAAGDYVVLAWNAFDNTEPITALVIDGDSLKIRSTSKTGVLPDEMLQATVLPSTEHDAVIAISRGDTPAIHLEVWTLDENVLTPVPELPVNAGLQIAASDMDSVYVYNGPAENTVGVLDLGSGRFEPDLPAFHAPSGSYVVGLMRG